MKGTIDYDSPIPYYVQVKGVLRERITHGDWQPGDQLPSEPELCRTFGVSRIVIRQALKEMTYEGLVTRRKGKGTYVAEPRIAEGLQQKLSGLDEDGIGRSQALAAQILKLDIVPASAKIAAYLRVEPETPVVELRRLRSVEGEPVVLVSTYLPSKLVPGIEKEDFTAQSLYGLLEKHLGLAIARGRRTIGAVAANEHEARLLRVDKGAPLILLDSVSYLADGTPIEYSHALQRTDRARIEVEVVREREYG